MEGIDQLSTGDECSTHDPLKDLVLARIHSMQCILGVKEQ